MTLMLIGLNHKTAPVDVREKLSIQRKDLPAMLHTFRAINGVEGASMVSTCNRVEVLISASNDDVAERVVGTLIQGTDFDYAEIEKHLYILQHADVVRHLFRVTSGLDSMIVGEPQSSGQVHDAFEVARDERTLDSLLMSLYEQTFRVAKRVRSETGIGEHAVSVPFAAVELAKKIFGDLKGLRALLIGAGEMAELTAEHLHGFGLAKVFVANRDFNRAAELATHFDGEAIRFDALAPHLSKADIVIASTSAPHYVISREQVEQALSERRRKDLFFIDLSVPRNLDPEIASADGAYLYNIDDLQEVADSNKEKRLRKAEAAEEMVEREVETFLRRLASHEAIPTIVELQSRLDTIRQAELEKCLRKLGPITTEQRAAIEMLSTGIINKVLHYPIVRLKESAADAEAREGAVIRETIRRIFGLR